MLATLALMLVGGGIWAIRKYQMPLPSLGGIRSFIPSMSLLTVGIVFTAALELWLIWAIIGNPFSNPVAFVGTLIILGAINIGLYKIYKAGGAKITVQLAYAALFLGGILGLVAVISGPDSAANLLTWGQNGVTESVNWLTDSDTTPGTTEVTTTNYIGRANGTHTIRDDVWTVIDWPYLTCPRIYPAEGVLVQGFANAHAAHFLSRAGDRQVEFRTLNPGETWKGYTCGSS